MCRNENARRGVESKFCCRKVGRWMKVRVNDRQASFDRS